MDRSEDQYLSFKNYIWNTLDKTFFISEFGHKEALRIMGKKTFHKFNTSKLGTPFWFVPNYYVDHKALVIVSCSFIYAIKRIDLIVKTLTLFDDLNIVWHHFGSGDDFKKISSLAENHLGNKKVFYKLHGHIKNSEILKFYHENKVDLFINVSSTEGIPVSMMEAMSMGIPVIATTVGGVPEIVKHNYNGWLLSANPNELEIRNAISAYNKLPFNEKINYKKNAHNTWKEFFNAEINYTKFLHEIDQL
jgi:glycosyltransferase involved in cell wall biosynthesis